MRTGSVRSSPNGSSVRATCSAAADVGTDQVNGCERHERAGVAGGVAAPALLGELGQLAHRLASAPVMRRP